ncbi:unnamed protein product [Closterium sp. NIES-65]|nr:unnamed protein product [Closterium sp. NIES-65]
MRLPASCDLSALLTHLIAHLGCHPAINPALNSSLPGNAVQKRASTVDDAEDMVGAGGMAVYAWDRKRHRQWMMLGTWWEQAAWLCMHGTDGAHAPAPHAHLPLTPRSILPLPLPTDHPMASLPRFPLASQPCGTPDGADALLPTRTCLPVARQMVLMPLLPHAHLPAPIHHPMVLMPLLPHAHLPAQAHARTDAKEPEQGESEARIQVESQVDLQVEPTEPVVVAGGGAVKVLLFEPLVGLGTPEVEFLKPGAFTSAELDIIVSTVQSAIDSSSPFLLSLFSFSGGRVSQARRIHTRRA